MIESTIIKRIPGEAPISRKEKQGYLEDLCKLSKFQLTELLERQNALIRNKVFVLRLPDKGEKILNFKVRIEAELARRAEVDKTTALLERLNINGPVEEIEWTGSFASAKQDKELPQTDEEMEDEEIKTIRIIASHGRTSKITRVLKPPESLVTEKDLLEIKVQNDPYATALCKKVSERLSLPAKESFKPFRTIKKRDVNSFRKPNESPGKTVQEGSPSSNAGGIEHKEVSALVAGIGVDDEKVPEAEISSSMDVKNIEDGVDIAVEVEMVKRIRYWEVTAATPPPPVHGQTLMIDLEESLALEKAAVEKTIAVRNTQAMLRLTEQLQRESFTRYRKESESSSEEEGHEEEHEEEDEEPEKDEAVVYSLVD